MKSEGTVKIVPSLKKHPPLSCWYFHTSFSAEGVLLFQLNIRSNLGWVQSVFLKPVHRNRQAQPDALR